MFLPFVGLSLGVILLLSYFWRCEHAWNEPPIVSAKIPYIGHIIGLLKYGSRYYQIIRYLLVAFLRQLIGPIDADMSSARCNLPIYTLPMLNSKVYVVTSIDLVNAVNRNSKVLAFNPFIAQVGKRITGHDDDTGRIVQHNLNGENGPGYVTEIHDRTLASLAPGQDLERMTKAMLHEASLYLETLEHGNEIDLFTWTRHMSTMCSTKAIYGPDNIFNQDEQKLVKAFWYDTTTGLDLKLSTYANLDNRDFDHDLNALIVNFAPGFFAPKGNEARSTLGTAFQRYFEHFRSGQANDTALVKARHLTNQSYGIDSWNAARLEVGVLLGILANTIPTVFYMLVHVLSDHELLRDLREELSEMSMQQSTDKKTCYLKVLAMRENCALLHSTFQEVLRVHALGTSSRYVREDVILQNQYLLKQGMIVQMPMAVMHSDPSSWGTNANSFQPRRFMGSPSHAQKAKVSAAAYRPFGGGASLCPGRHFVTLEAMALTASFILRFDVDPVDGGWKIPAQKQESMATNVFPPETDLRIRIKERKGYESVQWDFLMI